MSPTTATGRTSSSIASRSPHLMASSSSSRISAVRPLWAVEGGRVTISGDGLRGRSLAAARVHRRRARPAVDRVAARADRDRAGRDSTADTRPCGSPRRWARPPSSRSARRWRPGCTRSTAPPSTRRQPVCDFQRIARAGRPGVDLHRPARRLARTVRHRPRQPDVARVRRGRAAARLEPVRRQRASRRCRRARHHGGDRPRCRVRHRVSADGSLYVGDRSGSILRVRDGTATVFASSRRASPRSISPSAPTAGLYVTAPTLDARDDVYRVSPDGDVEVFYAGFGRPQGLAFDAQGDLYVVDALAGGERRLPHASRMRRSEIRAGRRRAARWSGSRSTRAAGWCWPRATPSSAGRPPSRAGGAKGLIPRTVLLYCWPACISCFAANPSPSSLAEDAHTLRRVLGAGDLIMLAIGAVIGAGIFSSIGTAAAGETLPSGESSATARARR